MSTEIDRPITFDDQQQVVKKGSGRLTVEELKIRRERLNMIAPLRDEAPDQVAIHVERFNIWQLGFTYQEMASLEETESNNIRRSIFYTLLRTPIDERLRIQNAQVAARIHMYEAPERIEQAMTAMFENKKGWVAMNSYLTNFRKMVGMEGTSNVTVHVDNRKQSINVNAGASTFESAMDRLRAKQLGEQQQQLAAEAQSTSIDVEIVQEDV